MAPKQLAFIAEYLLDGAEEKAALRAGYSKKTAAKTAARLLAMPEVQTAIRVAKYADEKSGPDKYDRDEVLPLIYSRVASGISLSRVLSADKDLPSSATFWRWHMEDVEIRDNLARARENGVEALMDESLDIADDATDDYINTEEGRALDREHIQRSKLRVDTRHKYAQMIAPRKYAAGMKVDVTVDADTAAMSEIGQLTRLAAIGYAIQSRIAEGADDASDDA